MRDKYIVQEPGIMNREPNRMIKDIHNENLTDTTNKKQVKITFEDLMYKEYFTDIREKEGNFL